MHMFSLKTKQNKLTKQKQNKNYEKIPKRSDQSNKIRPHQFMTWVKDTSGELLNISRSGMLSDNIVRTSWSFLVSVLMMSTICPVVISLSWLFGSLKICLQEHKCWTIWTCILSIAFSNYWQRISFGKYRQEYSAQIMVHMWDFFLKTETNLVSWVSYINVATCTSVTELEGYIKAVSLYNLCAELW